MAHRVLLHVGAMKSGTTYIQNRLRPSADALAEQRVLFPGATFRHQVLAVSDVLGHSRQGPVDHQGRWQPMADRIRSFDGTAIISMELLGPAAPEGARRVVESFPGSIVDVVITARDLGRNIPAMWQETVRNYRTWSWEEHLREVRNPRTRPGPGVNFWRQQDVASMARTWGELVGREHVTVVTVPPAGAPEDVLWERFCEVAGIEPTSCRPPQRGNPGLGAASVLALRELNLALRDRDLPWRDYTVVVKEDLTKNGMAPRRGQEPAIGFKVPRWVVRRSRRLVAELEGLGVRVVGDLDDLRPRSVPGVDPRKVPHEQVLKAAGEAMADLVTRVVGGPETAAAGRRSDEQAGDRPDRDSDDPDSDGQDGATEPG